MDIKLTQNQRLEQKQILAPLQQQSLKLLQMPTIELLEKIEQELEENPCLEVEDENNPGEENEQPVKEEKEYEEYYEEVNPLDKLKEKEKQDVLEEFSEYLKEELELPYYNRTSYEEDEEYHPFKNISTKKSSYEILIEQIRSLYDENSLNYKIAEFIIYNLDRNGILKVNPVEIAKKLHVSVKKVEEIRKEIMNLDPPGIGATSLQELLIHQAKVYGIYDEVVKKILGKYYDDFLNKRINSLLQKLGLSREQLIEYLEKLKEKLDPKPLSQLEPVERRTIVPDLEVIQNDKGEWEIRLLDDRIPRLRINKYYRNLLLKGDLRTEEEKAYLEKYLKRAKWYIQNIMRRQETIYKVAKAIMEHQREFLEKGPKYLKPLTLKDIADELGYHETTISRTVNGKYIQTPHGLYELKHFFSSGLETSRGENTSSNAIKMMIKEIIENEDPRKPLSDSKIAEILKSKGIKIARRTVHKYRESLGILPTHLRKKF